MGRGVAGAGCWGANPPRLPAATARPPTLATHPPSLATHPPTHPPPHPTHPPTQVYPLPCPSIEADEDALYSRRAALHALWGLPPNRPLLRVATALALQVGGGGGGAAQQQQQRRLADVHVGVAPSPVGGSVHLIQGTYDYCHYMQVCTRACVCACVCA